MHLYTNFDLNIIVNYETKIDSLKEALENGVDISKSEKFSKLVEDIKEQKSYERTIKLVSFLINFYFSVSNYKFIITS